MKQLLLTIVLAVLVVAATAQETRKTFCEIVGTGKVLSSKVKNTNRLRTKNILFRKIQNVYGR